MSRENVEIVRRGTDATSGDLDEILENWAPD
jgi:hypothetical protein